MTSLPTRLTAEQVAEIVEYANDDTNFGVGMMRLLISHVAALEGELSGLQELPDQTLNMLRAHIASLESDLAACRRPFDPVVLSMLYSAADHVPPTLRGAVLRAYEALSAQAGKGTTLGEKYPCGECGEAYCDCPGRAQP